MNQKQIPKKRSTFEKICCCLCDDDSSKNQNPQNIQQQYQQNNMIQLHQQISLYQFFQVLLTFNINKYGIDQQRLPPPEQQIEIQIPQNPQNARQPKQDEKNKILGMKRDFNLTQSQISFKAVRQNEEDCQKYKYECPICSKFFNSMKYQLNRKILKTKCCQTYICFECEYEIYLQNQNKKDQLKCWWCNRVDYDITDVQENEIIKNYSDEAQQMEDQRRKDHEQFQNQVRESKILRQSMIKPIKSQIVGSMFGKIDHSQNVYQIPSSQRGINNRNQQNDLNQIVDEGKQNEEEDEEEKEIDVGGINQLGSKLNQQPQNMNNSLVQLNEKEQQMPLNIVQSNLEPQNINIDNQINLGGYFFINQQSQNQQQQENQIQDNNEINSEGINLMMTKARIREHDPYANGPHHQYKESPHQINEKQLSSDNDFNRRENYSESNDNHFNNNNNNIDNYNDINDRS